MKKFGKYVFFSVLVFILSFIFYYRIHDKVLIRYWDEQAWIARGYYFELFIKGNWKDVQWENRLLQPAMTDYLLGATVYNKYLKEKAARKDKDYDMRKFLISHGFYDEESGEMWKYKYYKKSLDYFPAWNKEDFDVSGEDLMDKYGIEFKKTVDLIYQERMANVILLSLNAVVIFLISYFAVGFYPAIVITFLLATNNFVSDAGIRAQTDGLFLFLFNFSLALMILAIKKNRYFAFLFAFVVGLLWQTKLNGVMMLMIFNLVYLFKKEPWYEKIVLLMSVNMLAFLVFINLNFFIIRSPIKNTLIYYDFKQVEALEQARDYPSDALYTYSSRIIAIQKNFLKMSHFRQITEFFPFLNEVSKSVAYKWIYVVGFLIGIYKAIRQSIQGKKSLVVFIFIVFLLSQLIMGQYMILNWDRYYIQLSFFFIFFSVYGYSKTIDDKR